MALFRNWRLGGHGRKLISRRCAILRDASSSNWSTLVAFRGVHSSPALRGLQEFFPKGDAIEEGESAGRQWEARELRQKSNEDLHKLWYVLLKERNMLMTVKHEASRTGFIMPAPERMWKVRKSMARIKVVLGERERAITAAKEKLNNPEPPAEEELLDSELEEEEEESQSEPSKTPSGSSSHSIAQ